MLRFKDQVLDAKAVLRDGTHRAATLAETWRRFAPAAKRAGITRIAEITGLTSSNVGYLLHVALKRLREQLAVSD